MRKPRKETLRTTGLFHKMWQGHDLGPVLANDIDKKAYLDQLGDTLSDEVGQRVQWHSYCLMSTHPHETGRVNPDADGGIDESIDMLGNWMRNAHSRFAQQYNRRHNRRGKVACERPKTKELDDEEGLLTAMFYGDANPVAAGIVAHPKNYRWSSYRLYAFGERNEITKHLTPPPAYIALGRNAEERQRRYRQRCDAYLRAKGLLDDSPEIDVELADPSVEIELAQTAAPGLGESSALRPG